MDLLAPSSVVVNVHSFMSMFIHVFSMPDPAGTLFHYRL